MALTLAAVITSAIAGQAVALVFCVLVVAIVGVVALCIADSEHRDRVFIIAVGILLARIAVTSVLHLFLQQQNAGGAMFEDDFGYVRIGDVLARMWRGEAVSAEQMPQHFDPSTVHSYSRSVGALFLVFGTNVVVAKIANTALSILAALFFYRATLVVGDRTAAVAALIALSLWPSLALWTSLALKEGLALVCAGGAAWSVTELLRRPQVRWFAAMLGFTLPLQDARPYLHAILLGLWPVSLVMSRLATGGPSLKWAVAAAVAAGIAITSVRAGLAISPSLVGSAESVRTNMAEGATSAIVEATRRFEAEPGSCFVVRIPGTGGTSGGQQVHMIPPNTPLVYAERATTEIEPPRGALKVRDGDIVCVEAVAGVPVAPPKTEQPDETKGGGAPVAPSTPEPLVEVIVTTTGSTRMADTTTEAEAALVPAENEMVRNLAYLPRGAMFLVGAPFPWDIGPHPVRWPLFLEMLLWYATFATALLGLAVGIRERRQEVAYVVLVALAVGFVLSLVEGNLGTLVRHRGMLVPWAVVLSALVIARWPPVANLVLLAGLPRDRHHAASPKTSADHGGQQSRGEASGPIL